MNVLLDLNTSEKTLRENLTAVNKFRSLNPGKLCSENGGNQQMYLLNNYQLSIKNLGA